MAQPVAVPSAEITPQLARHVLHFFGRPLGQEPGSFTTSLLEAISHADTENLERLRVSFPNHVRAYLVATQVSNGIEQLSAIASVR